MSGAMSGPAVGSSHVLKGIVAEVVDQHARRRPQRLCGDAHLRALQPHLVCPPVSAGAAGDAGLVHGCRVHSQLRPSPARALTELAEQV